MPGFANGVMFSDNVDFSGGFPVVGKVTTNGQLLIGSTASPHIKIGSLTSLDSSLTITAGSGTLDISSGIISSVITLSSANILSMGSVPVQILPAPGAGSAYSIISCLAVLDFNTTPYDPSVAGDMQIIIGTSVLLQFSATTFVSASSDFVTSAIGGTVSDTAASYVNAPAFVTTQGSGDFTAGDSTIRLYITYRKIATGL